MYQYCRLRKQGEIRLLKLDPSEDPAAAVQGSLTVAKLDGNHEFEALSYCWGDRSADEPVIYIDGQLLKVTKNLHSALLHLRQRSMPIWIDAICINQQDTTERTRQVRHMDSIYSSARLVIVWLGEPSAADVDGFAFARTLTTEFAQYVQEEKHNSPAGFVNFTPISERDIETYAKEFVTPFLRQRTSKVTTPVIQPGSFYMPTGVQTFPAILSKDWFHRTWGK